MKLKQFKLLLYMVLFIFRGNQLLLGKMAFRPSLVGQFPGSPPALRQTGYKRSPFWSRHWLSGSAIASDMLLSQALLLLCSFLWYLVSEVTLCCIEGQKWSPHRDGFKISKFIYCTCCMFILGQCAFCSLILKWKSRPSLRHTNLTAGGNAQSQSQELAFKASASMWHMLQSQVIA